MSTSVDAIKLFLELNIRHQQLIDQKAQIMQAACSMSVFGDILSSCIPDIIPAEFCETFESFQKHSPDHLHYCLQDQVEAKRRKETTVEVVAYVSELLEKAGFSVFDPANKPGMGFCPIALTKYENMKFLDYLGRYLGIPFKDRGLVIAALGASDFESQKAEVCKYLEVLDRRCYYEVHLFEIPIEQGVSAGAYLFVDLFPPAELIGPMLPSLSVRNFELFLAQHAGRKEKIEPVLSLARKMAYRGMLWDQLGHLNAPQLVHEILIAAAVNSQHRAIWSQDLGAISSDLASGMNISHVPWGLLRQIAPDASCVWGNENGVLNISGYTDDNLVVSHQGRHFISRRVNPVATPSESNIRLIHLFRG